MKNQLIRSLIRWISFIRHDMAKMIILKVIFLFYGICCEKIHNTTIKSFIPLCACNLDYSKTILFAPSCICWVQGSVKYRTRKTSTFMSILLLNKINVHYFTVIALIFFFLFFLCFAILLLQHCPL